MAIRSPEPSTLAEDALARRRARRGTLAIAAVVLGLVTLVVLLTPVSDSGRDTRLTTRSFGPGNARLAADLARRLGWRVRTTDAPLRVALDSTNIYAVFDGPTPMSTAERVALLDAVRRGAGLLVAPATETPFALLDSLGLRTGEAGDVTPTPLGGCPRETDPLGVLRVRSRMVTFDTATPKRSSTRSLVSYPAGARTLLASDLRVVTPFGALTGGDERDDSVAASGAGKLPTRADRLVSGVVTADSAGAAAVRRWNDSAAATRASRSADSSAGARSAGAVARQRVTPVFSRAPDLQPTMVAFQLGRGRVVALADPDVLRTDQMRNCAMGSALSVVRALEYLSEGRRREIVFAEYYQLPRDDGAGTVLMEWLRDSGAGRAVLTLIAAGLVLLFARGRRTLAPVYRAREERRSALEHVDALATAWQAVRGTRTVARMLARGIRRRHAAGRWRAMDDAEFLAALSQRHPAIADDAAILARAMHDPAAPTALPALRQAAAHIDAECLTP